MHYCKYLHWPLIANPPLSTQLLTTSSSTFQNNSIKTDSWAQKPASHASIWDPGFSVYLTEDRPWAKREKKPEPIIAVPKTRARKKVVNMVPKYVAETQYER